MKSYLETSRKNQNTNQLQDVILPLLPAFSDMFNLPASVTISSDAETVSFDNIQLSVQGSERQKKDVTWFVGNNLPWVLEGLLSLDNVLCFLVLRLQRFLFCH